MRFFRLQPASRCAPAFVALAVSCLVPLSQAATVQGFSPEGEAGPARQVRVVFSEPMVPLGNAMSATDAAPPLTLACSEAAAGAGRGRWTSPTTWVIDLERMLPAGVSCTASLAPGLRTLAGSTVEGRGRFVFTSGGPSILQAEPWSGNEDIEESQHFRLRLNGAVDPDSVARSAWCQVAGVRERIPVVVVERDPLLGARNEPAPPGHSITVRCQRPSPPGATLRLVWAAGIRSTTGVARGRDQRLDYRVRAPFTAAFSCQRENAQAPCSPLSPMEVRFSAPVPAALAASVTLQVAGRAIKGDVDPAEGLVEAVQFAKPFPENAELSIGLPPDLRDASGRKLANAALFPLRSRTGQAPPLLKFAAAPFGIVERAPDAAVPLTVRRIDGEPKGSVAVVRTDDDAQVLAWLAQLLVHHQTDFVPAGPPGQAPAQRSSREISILPMLGAPASAVRRLDLPPAASTPRPMEVVGIPMPEPGFHVIEARSSRLGAALLAQPAPLYVRTGVLVTGMAMHLKIGQARSAVWVTSLETGRPVAGAQVRLSDCKGREHWRGRTDAQGIAVIDAALPDTAALDCPGWLGEWFASARATDAQGRADYTFVGSNWDEGIEPWRFGMPMAAGDGTAPTLVAHTVFDRTLLRAGETVSMKHFMRAETIKGLSRVDAARLPKSVRISHEGTDRSVELPLSWTGGRWAESRFPIPRDAPLGTWSVTVGGVPSGRFDVAEFRLPVLAGSMGVPTTPVVAPGALPVDLKLGYLSGGPAAGLPVTLSAGLRRVVPRFERFQQYRFDPPGLGDDDAAAPDDETGLRMVAEGVQVKLDAGGAARPAIQPLPALRDPAELVVEATYPDPNGEIQTLSRAATLWPSAVAVGIRTEQWVSQRGSVRVATIALDAAGRPQADVPVAVRATSARYVSSRKRLVGGLYVYDTRRDVRPAGKGCEGRTDREGRFSCDVAVLEAGMLVLTAEATDGQGRVARAGASVWSTGTGEVWFDAESADRMDLLPEKPEYAPGETARLQVRMPFRHATAWIAIEREGVIETRVVQLSGRDPTIEVPVRAEHAPNVYVSVLAVRARVREVPWYSLLTWGWKDPRQWWSDRRNTVDHHAPTAMIDLGKPAFKLGLAQFRVGRSGHALKVSVTTDRQQYQTRETVRARVQVLQPDGKPAPAGTEVAIAAVDEALLELADNDSWNLLDGLLQERGHGVRTATAQMQVVGKRHFGRKAVAAGGGGGRSPTRELFDTLLVWRPSVVLDAKGEAAFDVPLNDSLTRFRIVAVADVGDQWFGTGAAAVVSSKDLQIASGLPPMVRDGDRFSAMATLRNNTTRAMEVRWSANAAGQPPATGQVSLAPGAAQAVEWPVAVPSAVDTRPTGQAAAIDWVIEARDAGSGANDRVAASQRVVPAVPVTVQQAVLVSLGSGQARDPAVPVAPPDRALPGRGGLSVRLSPRLADGLEGVRRWFEAYPHACIEQLASRAIGLRDASAWASLMRELPSYLDANGLVAYWPVGAGLPDAGSDVLTAYLVTIADEASRADARFALDPALRGRMADGLTAFVEGRLQPRHWSARRDLDARRLAAIDALSRAGRLRARWLDTVEVSPQTWPTSMLLDFAALLARSPQLPQRDAHAQEVERVLRARLSVQGTKTTLADSDSDRLWWLMIDGDVNAARLLAHAVDRPEWRQDAAGLMVGLMGRQQRGAWSTTTANAWGTVAASRFSQAFESAPVSGHSAVALRAGDKAGSAAGSGGAAGVAGVRDGAIDWSRQAGGGTLQLGWADGALGLAHRGEGRPWALVQALAAVPARTPIEAGYRVSKAVEPVTQKQVGVWSRGDVLRVRLRIDARADASWVALVDPIPAGATILGSGLGRDSGLAARDRPSDRRSGPDAPNDWWPEHVERSHEAYRAYFRFAPAGSATVEYVVRVNNAGSFALPPTRVEAMYNPEMFGIVPNAAVTVSP